MSIEIRNSSTSTTALTAIGSMLALVGGVVACGAVHDADAVAGSDGESVASQEAALAPGNLPSPRAFVSGLDLECYRSEGPAPVQELGIRQLNPVLKDRLPNQRIKVGDMLHTCLPVAKNNNIPPQDVLRFISQVDLACYRAEADPVDVEVNLRHLNPVLQNLPDEDVRLTKLRRFCSPVRKNFSQIDAPVRRLVEQLDLACYELEHPTFANFNLWLSHLNPVVRAFNFPNRLVQLEQANQLCVPVGKNQQPIPEDVLSVVQWVDMLSYQFDLIMPPPPAFPLWLSQLNPLFAGVPPTWTVLEEPRLLMVPVAKDNTPPPL